MYLGIDVGFSREVRSTGICVIDPMASSPVRSAHVKTNDTFGAIRELLSKGSPLAIGIDGPLIPRSLPHRGFLTASRYRNCERMLSGGIFQKRCKPGPTNSPRGYSLHKQSTSIANRLQRMYPSIQIARATG
jgi:hypothetical protein